TLSVRVRMRHTLVALSLVACTGSGPVGVATSRQPVITGAGGFAFLPPLAPQPASSGVFDASLQPTVEVVQVSADGLTTFPLPSSSKGGGRTILDGLRVDPDAQQYNVEWHTSDNDLVDGTRYRIVVSVGAKLLGYADVQPYPNLGKFRRHVDGELEPFVDGSTLPIKFWVPKGAVRAPIGVNMPDLLWAYLGIAPTTADGARKIMDDARAAGITHARFIANVFWPDDLVGSTGWVTHPDAFFA